jgi:hypothetical protein
MAGIQARRRKDGTMGYTARVRIREGQTTVHKENQTFSSKTVRVRGAWPSLSRPLFSQSRSGKEASSRHWSF